MEFTTSMDVQDQVQTTTAGTDLDDALIDSIINGGSDLLNQGINLGGDTMHKVTEKLSSISNPEDWVLGLHQVLLFFLVIGRWMLPRGGIR